MRRTPTQPIGNLLWVIALALEGAVVCDHQPEKVARKVLALCLSSNKSKRCCFLFARASCFPCLTMPAVLAVSGHVPRREHDARRARRCAGSRACSGCQNCTELLGRHQPELLVLFCCVGA